jgi:XTP/dITP diphosphohydrolase
VKLVLASQNPHKIRELRAVLPEHWELLTPSDLGIEGELAEDGTTLQENAQQKSEFLWLACGLPSLADDSGLEVDFLNGLPGVHSAFFAGPQKSDSDNRAKLLLYMKGAVDRKARFKTILAWTTQAGTSLYLGQVEGEITREERGSQGFGYDSLFVPSEGDGRTFAEMQEREKSLISHRSRAVAAWLTALQKS